MPQTNKKHFLLMKNGGVISATTPKDWARANRHLFPNYTFVDGPTTPITYVIEEYLRTNLGFKQIGDDDVVIHYSIRDA